MLIILPRGKGQGFPDHRASGYGSGAEKRKNPPVFLPEDGGNAETDRNRCRDRGDYSNHREMDGLYRDLQRGSALLKFITQWRWSMMKTANSIEQEINRIRLHIYEETKDMNPQQRAERVNRIGEEATKKYGFKRVARAD